MRRVMIRATWWMAVALCCALGAPKAHAFCGFYVAGPDTDLVNDATMVVLMRDGMRTVLSMQNHYQGPPENFAMVVPVPVVLGEDDVKVLSDEIFARVEQLSAPRLVEYWETDPCYVEPEWVEEGVFMEASAEMAASAPAMARELGVVVEAEFAVGEYEIAILSANDSSGLDTWLRANGYTIPEGAEPVLRPYVEADMKFFVAKVDVTKVTFEDGAAQLSPLRFHYDTESFSLPVRLGLLNSDGTQDLIVHILAANQRYELANYENVTVPTNIDVDNSVRERFGEFYAALFDETMSRNPGAIVTEYSWQATNCDPCPGPVLTMQDIMTLGGDVLSPNAADALGTPGSSGAMGRRRRQGGVDFMNFVLTRLHTRYDRDALNEDLVFRAAPPIVGGREMDGPDGLEHGASASSYNNFQGRYAIRHEWEGRIDCDDPVRGRWGGPPAGSNAQSVRPATDLAFATRGELELASVVRSDVPELSIDAAVPEAAEAATPAGTTGSTPASSQADGGCGSCSAGAGSSASFLWSVLLLGLWVRRRR